MTNKNKGFIVPVLLGIIALLVIGGGVYVYQNKKVETSTASIDDDSQTINQVQTDNTQTPAVASTKPSITVLSPNGSEVLRDGNTYTINWKTLKLPATAKMYITLVKDFKGDIDYNENSKNIVSGLSSTVTNYSWKVDTSGLSSGGDYTILVVATWGDFDAGTFARVYDTSNAQFSINSNIAQPSLTIISPKKGDLWKMGQMYTISYSVTGDFGPVTIKLNRYSDDGTFLQSIDVGTSETNSFVYKVPTNLEDTRGTAGRFKIEVYPGTARELVKRSEYFSIIR